MVQAAIGSVLGAFGSQSHTGAPAYNPRQDTSTLAIATSTTDKRARAARKNADRERLQAILQDPAVLGILSMMAGIYIAQNIPWSGDPIRRDALARVMTASVVLMSLGRAGVGDLTTLTMAGVAGVAGGTGGAEGLLEPLLPTTEGYWDRVKLQLESLMIWR